MRCGYPQPLKLVRFIESPLFNRLNISRADIPCVLENDVEETAMQPVTLYMTVDIASPILNNSPQNIPTEQVVSPAEEATLPGRNQSLTLTSTKDHSLLVVSGAEE